MATKFELMYRAGFSMKEAFAEEERLSKLIDLVLTTASIELVAYASDIRLTNITAYDALMHAAGEIHNSIEESIYD